MVASKTKKSTIKKPAKAKASPKSGRPASSKIHVSKTRVRSSRLARSKDFSRKSYHILRRVIFVVIILAMLIVILATLLSHFSDPERLVKTRIEDIAADYYENYFYTKIESYTSQPTEKILESYKDKGTQKYSLDYLLLFDGERHSDSAAVLTKYCDENDTYVKYFPVEPYGKTDYRAEITYACIF
ncbi:hypothetical protein IJH06_01015 [Candidatus Saccharibacteria bacterium]|nr:hypothetical protein [Candidatus Saccharibacteria bacterium]